MLYFFARMKRFLAILLSFALGAGAFALVLYFSDSDLDDVWEGIAEAGWRAAGAMAALVLAQLAIQAWSWRFLLARNGRSVPFRACLGGVTVGWAGNYLTPSMYLGGEAVRALYVARPAGLQRREVLATVLVHKVLEFTTFLLFLLASSVILVVRFHEDLTGWILAMVVVANILLVSVLVVLYVSVIGRWSLFVRLCDGVAFLGIARRWLAENRRKVLELQGHIHRAFLLNRAATCRSLAAMLPFTLVLFVRPLAFFAFLPGRTPLGVADLALVFCLVQLLQAFQLTPGGLGILEGGIPAIFLLVGVPAVTTLGFVALQRMSDFLFVGIGFGLFAHRGLSRLQAAT
ncbi:MAG: flippase-like domain-containing protein [Planctomycetes bacterium]|nr:flippase-like domain-containing protein [Planctomycetota bacterium]